MKQKIGLIAAVVGGVLTVLGALSPDRVDNLRLDFGLFLLRQLRYEVIILLALGVLFYTAKPLRSLFSSLWLRRPQFSTFSDNQKVAAILLGFVTVGLSLLMILGTVVHVGLAATTRLSFYRHLLYHSYRDELIHIGLAKEREGQPDKAILYYRQILRLFPNDPRNNYRVQQRIDQLEARLKYARDYLERSQKLEKQSGLSRQSFLLLVEALRLDPTDDFIRIEVKERMERLKRAEPKIAEFYSAYANKNKEGASKLFDEWSWYLFEEYFAQDLKTGKSHKLDIELDLPFMRRVSSSDFREAVVRSWEMENAEKILDQSKESGEN
jgi:tetratricopeptide (TPR) repeat protein